MADAQEPEKTTTGTLGAGILVAGDSSQNPWKLKEYRDLNDGIVSMFSVRRRAAADYLDAFGENLGRNDQRVEVRGGRFDTFKYQVFDDRMVHNWTFGARTPYGGVGTNTLTAILPNLNADTWNTFDFRKKRENFGGMFEANFGSPWYVRVDANEVREKGLQLIAGANGTSPGNGFIDKPFPVDYKTQNVSVEGGYATRRGQFSVSALHSKFSNANETLRWTNPFFGNGLDQTWLPPANEYTKLAANGVLRQLPYGSTLSGRLSIAHSTSEASIAGTALNTGGVLAATNPDEGTFRGNVLHKTASLSLHSNWTRELDSRAYWNWVRKDNNSTEVTFVNPPAGLNCGGGSCTTELLGYRRSNFGAEAGYRVNPTNRLIGGVDYVSLNRNRVDFDETKDYRLSAEWRNTSYDWLGTRLKYQHLQRRSHFLEGNAGTGATDPAFLDRFIRRFDAANVDQELIKLAADLHPMEFTDLGIEASWKYNKYKDTVLGRTRDDRTELYASAAYGDPKKWRVMVFGDLEYVKYDSLHRTATIPGNFDPNAAPSATNFDWGAKNIDRSWLVGLGTDWLPREFLKFTASAIWQWTHGTADFSPQAGATLVPIGNFDNSRKFSLNAKGTYSLTKRWDLTAGYAYEKYSYSDIAVDGYQYTIPSGTSTSYLSGAYAFPNYSANIAYLMATLKF